MQANNTYQWSDNFSKVIGKHMLKFGGELHYDQVNINPRRDLQWLVPVPGHRNRIGLRGLSAGHRQQLRAGRFASLLPAQPLRRAVRAGQLAGASPKPDAQLRPALGPAAAVAREIQPAPDAGPWASSRWCIRARRRAWFFPATRGFPPRWLPPATPTSPRVSAWPTRRIGPETSIRAGYGIFYTAFEGLSAGIMSANPPYGYDYTSLAPPLFATPFITAASGQDIGQRFPEPIPAVRSFGEQSQLHGGLVAVPADHRRAVVLSRECDALQRELHVVDRAANRRGTRVLSASYVGTQAHHLLVLISANPGNPALCLSLSQPQDVMPGTPTCGPFGESGTYITRSGQTIQGTRGPFSSQFAAVTYQKTIGNSNYNALEVVPAPRRAGRWNFCSGYTYGKSLDQSSSLAEAVNPARTRD